MLLAFARAARAAIGAAACALALLGSEAASAQGWPEHNITTVVPFAAGNAIDSVGRVVLDQVSKQVGRPIIIENRAGAGGTTGANAVAKSKPDGYTLLVFSSSFASAHSIYTSLPYDTLADFAAVAPIGVQPTVLVTAPTKPFRTVADVIAAAKARPGELNYASAGIGAASHLAAERFRVAGGFEAQHIPFRGPTDALTETMTGRVDFYFLPLAAALPLIQDGKLRALAVSAEKRSAVLPEVPTTAEAGLADSAYPFWAGLFLPAKTPRDIVGRLHDETEKALGAPTVRDRITKLGYEPMNMSPEAFQEYFKNDVIATAKLVKAAKIPTQERN